MSSRNSVACIGEDVVRAAHEAQIAEHGGTLGIRDSGFLASALQRPRNPRASVDADIGELAAIYALGILKNHPFVDGNKRVGAVQLELFLNLNGFDLKASDETLLRVVYGAASGSISAADLKTWVRDNASPHSSKRH